MNPYPSFLCAPTLPHRVHTPEIDEHHSRTDTVLMRSQGYDLDKITAKLKLWAMVGDWNWSNILPIFLLVTYRDLHELI